MTARPTIWAARTHLEHDLRYDRADEFMEVVLGHWDTWDDGSLIIDKKSGRFADPTKVRRLDHKGSSSTRAGRSPCRVRRRAIRSSSRPAPAAAASALPAAGAR